jgi:hypothetical protein
MLSGLMSMIDQPYNYELDNGGIVCSLPRWTISRSCNSAMPCRLVLRIFFRACIGICLLAKLRKSSVRYLYTRIFRSGMVSSGTRMRGVWGSLRWMSSLKAVCMLGGMSLSMNLSPPDLWGY